MFFHQHKWVEVSQDYTPGIKLKSTGGLDAEELVTLYAGTTHIYSKCSVCGELKQTDLVGKYIP